MMDMSMLEFTNAHKDLFNKNEMACRVRADGLIHTYYGVMKPSNYTDCVMIGNEDIIIKGIESIKPTKREKN